MVKEKKNKEIRAAPCSKECKDKVCQNPHCEKWREFRKEVLKI